MPFYQSGEQFYGCARALFDRIATEHSDAANAVQKAKLIIRFQCTDPTVEFLINGRRNPVEVSYGPGRIRPELDISMPADVLHSIMLGDLSLAKALASGSLKVRGPAWKTITLGELFLQIQALYPQILTEQDLLT